MKFKPPYDWEKVLSFFEGRAIKGVELIKDAQYMRTVQIKDENGKYFLGWLRVVSCDKNHELKVVMTRSLLPVKLKIESQLRRLFDLDCDPHAIWKNLSKMNEHKQGLCVRGTRVPRCFEVFEMVVRAVLGQQITVKAAGTLANRIVQAYGKPIETEVEGLTHVFPTAEDILAMGGDIQDNFGRLGVTSARSHTILGLAKVIVNKEIDFETVCPEQEIKKLLKIKGIGPWTANYIAMRAMNWADAFLETDYGVKSALPTYTASELLSIAEEWRPYRSYAILNLWNSLK